MQAAAARRAKRSRELPQVQGQGQRPGGLPHVQGQWRPGGDSLL